VSHAWAVALAIPAVGWLAHAAPNARALFAANVYGLGLVMLFTVSALYHRVQWSPSARARMRTLDHSNIFVFIASSYTPIHLLGVGGTYGTVLCAACWTGALFGLLQTLFWPTAPRALHVGAYVVVGWTGALGLLPLARHTGVVPPAMLLVGGIVYTLGALVYARKRPDPWPGTFGYHEVFHALVIAACACLYVTVWGCVTAG
jgi:hemolysin III